MGFLQSLKQFLGKKEVAAVANSQSSSPSRSQSRSQPPTPPPEPEAAEVNVPERQVAEVLAGLVNDPPFLLDVREPFEWRQVRVPTALHIPMNDVPERLGELPRDRPILVFCAHGGRSYGVAHYLIEQGFAANSLAGGITVWARQGGPVEQ